MKIQIPILIISALVISSFGFNDVYASGPLSFDQTRIVINHSGIISCIGCTDVGPNFTAILKGPGGVNPHNVILYKIAGTTNYASNFVKFCDTSCSSNDFITLVGQHVSVEASSYTTAYADVFATGTLGAPTPYGVSAKSIQPNNSVSTTCANYGGDTDGDKICNAWENNSSYPLPCPASGPGLCIRTSATAKPYFLGCQQGSTDWSNACPDPNKADIYYEIDYMLGHKPSVATITAVADAFKSSNYVSANGITGIIFHAQLDEELPHVDSIPWKGSSGTPGYDQLKYWWFGTAAERTYSAPGPEVAASDWLNNNTPNESKRSEKAQVFHYAIFAHQISTGGTDQNSSGAAEMPGNDAIISLGSFDGKVGNKNQQQGTLLHEIGHNINLNHGGNEARNCKPNYISVMSYSLQFTDYVSARALDFSQSDLNDLIENNLNENSGVQASTPSGRWAAYGPYPALNSTTGVPIDWNRDEDKVDNPAIAPVVTPDINNFNITDCMGSYPNTLTGFKDWDRARMVLGPIGLITGGETDPDAPYDPDSRVEDGMLENTQLNELTAGDVIEMRTQRIDSILFGLDHIGDENIIGNAANVRETYKKDLDQVKTLIRQNIDGNNTMDEAYKTLDNFVRKLDGHGNDDIIKPNTLSLASTRLLVEDVISSESHSLGDAGDFNKLTRVILPGVTETPAPDIRGLVAVAVVAAGVGAAVGYILGRRK